jgi:peroxiredoxin
MVALGTPAPPFSLQDPEGVVHGLDDAADHPVVLIAFICNHCPFVKHLADELAALSDDYASRGVRTFAIMPNDVDEYPDDAPKLMAVEAQARGYSFPYLHDADQSVAKAYHATCTPDFFIYGPERTLLYRGQFDDSRPDSGTADGKDVRGALDDVLANRPIAAEQKPSLGCNIKWKTGNAPTLNNVE